MSIVAYACVALGRGRGWGGLGVKSSELGQGEGASGTHLCAHEIHDSVEALAGSRGSRDGALAFVGGADRQDRLQAGELARTTEVGGDGASSSPRRATASRALSVVPSRETIRVASMP